ncbi:hypothetical protein [Ruminococcus sp.]|jgi:hypothetical protein|uniref:hypothetical protein n=1 Tax=Ruminococcus sp. TaxID=41978 RepID=UPI0025F8489E|nr:hypothetical protein [Ruminococcus sp.]
MTDEERRNGMRVLKSVEIGIREVEKQTNIKILACSSIISNQSSDIVCFTGYNEIRYELPYQVFMTIPEKRIIIEVARALTIVFNDYGQ